LVDDHAMLREGLAGFLSRQSDLEICGEAGDAPEAMRQLLKHQPDFVIVDISLKSGHGIELVKQIHAHDESTMMLVLSMHDESLFAERAIRAGAMGYLNKEQSRTRILDAIRTILSGKIFLSEAMTAKMLTRTMGKTEQDDKSPVETLSDRELQVFELIGQGLTVREIAGRLQLSPKTVETYRENVKTKLDVGNATELVRYAVQWRMEQA
jgi:DNA-binding NarL/FixJ family response regulator